MKISNIQFSNIPQLTQKKNSGNNNAQLKADSFVSSFEKPSFKGKLNIWKKILNLLNKEKNTVKEETQVLRKTVKTKNTERVLPFNGEERLKATGFDEENIAAFLKAANGNAEHYNKMVRMRNAGIKEEFIPEIFKCCKNNSTDKLSTQLYYVAQNIHEKGIEDKYITRIINGFRESGSKFNKASFEKFEQNKANAFSEFGFQKGAFGSQSPSEVNEFFYNNIKALCEITDLVGNDTIAYLYKIESKHLKGLIEDLPLLQERLGMKNKILLNQKMKDIAYREPVTLDTNGGERKFTDNEILEIQDRLALLQNTIKLIKTKDHINSSNVEKEIQNILISFNSK